jgi:hypothetical protein
VSGIDPIRLQKGVHLCIGIHVRPVPMDKQHPRLLPVAIHVLAPHELGIQLFREMEQSLSGRYGVFEMKRVASGGKAEEPGILGHRGIQWNIKRRAGSVHPTALLEHDPRGAQRQELAKKEQAAVSMGGPLSDPVLFDQADRIAFSDKIIGTGQSNDPSADDEHIRCLFLRHDRTL